MNQFFYVIYYEKEIPIGKSIFQLMEFDTTTFNFDAIPCKYSNKVLRHFLNKKLTVLVAGNIFATGENTYHFIDGIGDESVFKRINIVIDDLFKVNKKINYTLFKEFYPTREKTKYLIEKHHYLQFNIDDDMLLKVDRKWHSFNDLLSEYKTKYRSRSKRVLEKSKSIIIKEFSLENIKENAIKMDELYQQVLKNSSFNIGVFKLQTFMRLKERLPDKYTVFGYFLNDNLIGFRTSFIHNNSLDASFIGLDYKFNLKYNLYQKILIDYVNYGLENKVKIINFGRTAETMKSCVGAEPIAMNLYIRAKHKYGRFLLRMIVNNIKPTVYSSRRPFKKQHYK